MVMMTMKQITIKSNSVMTMRIARKWVRLVSLSLIFAGVLAAPAGSVAKTPKKPLKVACIGNSITYGTGIADRLRDGYPAQLQRLLGEGYEVGSFGKPGACLLRRGFRPYNEQQEYRDALAFAGDIVVIHLGINDTDPRAWPCYRDEFVSDYLQLIDSLRACNPKARFILARMTPISDRHHRFQSGTKQWHGEIQQAIEQVARLSKADLIDFYDSLYVRPDLFPDGLHPNPEGAGIMAQTVYGAITGNYGGLRMPEIYQDYMVLQRNVPLIVKGRADAGEEVRVSFAGQKLKTRTNLRGEWQVQLQQLTEAGEDYELTVETAKKRLVYRHVAVGEVWLCSGQSNMAFMLRQAASGARDIPQADDPGLRLYNMQPRWETNAVEWPASACDSVNRHLYFRPASWQKATPASVRNFSAVAYYFGRMLRDSLGVPVGLICNAVGGSTAESWVDRETLETQFPNILRDWLKNDFIQDWARGRAALNIKQSGNPLSRHPYQPCYLYETAVRPLLDYAVQGVVWYQGESNAHNWTTHERLFQMLKGTFRKAFNNDRLPVIFAQLSSLDRPTWTWFRDSQRQLMDERDATYMAVTSDLGDSLDVHPRQKQPVGERMARWALARCYGKALVPSGPLFEKALLDGNKVMVTFRYGETLHAADGGEVRTFELAEEDGLFYPATAEVVSGGVRLQCPQVKRPRLVRYGWQPFTRANLVNGDGLPASTFRGAVD